MVTSCGSSNRKRVCRERPSNCSHRIESLRAGSPAALLSRPTAPPSPTTSALAIPPAANQDCRRSGSAPQRGDNLLHGRRPREDEPAHESKDRVVDLASLGDDETRALS